MSYILENPFSISLLHWSHLFPNQCTHSDLCSQKNTELETNVCKSKHGKTTCSQTLCSVFSRITIWSLEAFYTWIRDSLQILSSSVRWDGEHWWTTIFRSLQRCFIRFKSGLFTELFLSCSFVVLTVCFGLLSCWMVNLGPSLMPYSLFL